MIGVLVAAGDGQAGRAEDVGAAMRDGSRTARIHGQNRKTLGHPPLALCGGQSMTPLSEVVRRPSNVAEPFLWATAGKPNASIISTDIASVAQHVGVDRMLRHPF